MMHIINNLVGQNKDAIIALDENVKIALIVVIVLILGWGIFKKLTKLIITGVMLSVLYILITSLGIM